MSEDGKTEVAWEPKELAEDRTVPTNEHTLADWPRTGPGAFPVGLACRAYGCAVAGPERVMPVTFTVFARSLSRFLS